ncbi:serine/threonine-protein kinase Kist-like [Penaeus japonicus]|uniref:serine/threonine-protein kinase Kist-like n=1 Tax=Penaeus japonicus TaxID=27405 RepID=UPI001C711F7A|nr:serine/threonine-protein kinase Kist-like [Penaeus japonicus]
MHKERVNRKSEKVIKPQAVIDYNEGMKGVNVGDQLASSYPAQKKELGELAKCPKASQEFLSTQDSSQTRHLQFSLGYQAPESIYWNKKRLEVSSSDTPAVVRPGIPSDVWSAGCIVAEAIIGCQLFPSFCETNVNKAVRSALASSAANYSPQFLDGAYGFITRCLQIAPGDRANPRELLCSPWLAQAYRPTFHDLTLLRTTVLRILNVADAHQLEGIPEGKVVENYFLQLCKKHGDVIDYHLEVSLGAFFVQYHQASDAEEAYYILSKTLFNDRTLIVTFFDLDLWQQRELY